MHLSEFKAWFDGFTEEMKGPPDKAQWAKITKRVKEITADYTPATVFVDRYYPIRRYWEYQPYWGASSSGVGVSSTNAAQAIGGSSGIELNDWRAAGKAEYSALRDGTGI